MNDVIWKLFKETGDIKYYILLKKSEQEKWVYEDRRSRRYCFKWN